MNNLEKLNTIIDLLIEKTEKRKIGWWQGEEGSYSTRIFVGVDQISHYIICLRRCLTEADRDYYINNDITKIMDVDGKIFPVEPKIGDYFFSICYYCNADSKITDRLYISSQQFPTLKDRLIKLGDLVALEELFYKGYSDLIASLGSIK